MSIDLKKLENKLDETLSYETSETLNKFLTDKTMSNNKQSMKLYTEEQVIQMIEKSRETGLTAEYLILTTTPIELPSDEEIEEKLNVAYGNGYEQGEMDFYKKMQCKGDKYAEGYSEGYKRALELVKWKIDNEIQGGDK